MKVRVLLLCFVIFAACSSPQAPVPQGTGIPGLSIPDTIDFGVVRAGLSKDTNIRFKNNGTDTIHITSQVFNNSSFKLADNYWEKMYIVPGTSRVFAIRFTPTDTVTAFGVDTIRTADRTNIIVLRGYCGPFVNILGFIPRFVAITLTGAIGRYNGAYSFDFAASLNLSESQFQEYFFDKGRHWANTDYRNDVVEWGDEVTHVQMSVDSTLTIDFLTANYSYDDNFRGQGETELRNEGLKLHGIQLQKSGNMFVAVASGPSLRSIIDKLYRQCNGSDCYNYPPMDSLIGFSDSAKLSIVIQ